MLAVWVRPSVGDEVTQGPPQQSTTQTMLFSKALLLRRPALVLPLEVKKEETNMLTRTFTPIAKKGQGSSNFFEKIRIPELMNAPQKKDNSSLFWDEEGLQFQDVPKLIIVLPKRDTYDYAEPGVVSKFNLAFKCKVKNWTLSPFSEQHIPQNDRLFLKGKADYETFAGVALSRRF